MANNKKDDPRTIYKIHANNTFVSVIGPDINSNYDNIVMEFVEFDKNSNRKVGEIDIYYSIPEFLSLCQMIIDRTMINMIQNDKKRCIENNIKYSDARLLPKRGGGMVNNHIMYRENYFCSASSDRMNGMMIAEIMDGIKNQQGLINPKLTNGSVTNKKIIRVPFLFNDIYNMAMISMYRIQAFLTAKQLRGDFDRSIKDSKTNSEMLPNENYYDSNEDKVNEPYMNYSEGTPEECFSEPQYTHGYQKSSKEKDIKTELNPDEIYYQQYSAQYGYPV